MSADLRIGGHVPRAWLARQLWAAGVRDPELLEHAERWITLEEAIAECDRVELLLPLAVLRGSASGRVDPATLDRVAGVARAWWRTAVERLDGLEALSWGEADRELATRAVDLAGAPDVDVATLIEDAIPLGRRATASGPGLHRRRLQHAAAHVAILGAHRADAGFGAGASGWLAAASILGALEDAAASSREDLFQSAPDVEAWKAAALGFAREALRP